MSRDLRGEPGAAATGASQRFVSYGVLSCMHALHACSPARRACRAARRDRPRRGGLRRRISGPNDHDRYHHCGVRGRSGQRRRPGGLRDVLRMSREARGDVPRLPERQAAGGRRSRRAGHGSPALRRREVPEGGGRLRRAAAERLRTSRRRTWLRWRERPGWRRVRRVSQLPHAARRAGVRAAQARPAPTPTAKLQKAMTACASLRPSRPAPSRDDRCADHHVMRRRSITPADRRRSTAPSSLRSLSQDGSRTQRSTARPRLRRAASPAPSPSRAARCSRACRPRATSRPRETASPTFATSGTLTALTVKVGSTREEGPGARAHQRDRREVDASPPPGPPCERTSRRSRRRSPAARRRSARRPRRASARPSCS